MKSIRLTFALFLSLFAFQAFVNAQTQTVRGRIIDQQSEAPLIGATVELLESDPMLGIVTVIDGNFTLQNVPVGRQAFRVSYLGYNTITVPNILVTSGKEVQLSLGLEESITELSEVVVKADVNKDRPINEMATISARQFNVEEVQRYSGGRNDVAKLVANFAGVAANNDQRNDIIIRGNSPTGVLWRLEGIPIPNPNHFSTLGTTGGPVSAINPNMIGNSDFLTGAFPAEYGNALAGVFDINLRTGNRERFETTVQLGAFSGLEAMVEGPMLKKTGGSFVVAYRHSFTEIADAAGLNIGTNATPKYKDLTFNLDFGQTKAGKFSLFGIGGYSNIDFIAAELDSTDLYTNPNQNSYNVSQFGVLGLKHSLLLNDHSYWRTVLSVSGTGSQFYADDVEIDEGNPFRVIDVNDDITTYRLSSYYNNKINKRLTVRTGVLLQQQNLKTKVETREHTPDLDGDGIRDWFTDRDFDGSFNQAEGFAQGLYRLSENLTVNAGLHALYFDQTEDFALEPRVALNWNFAPKHSFNLGFGLHHQTQPLPVFLFQERQPDGTYVRSNENLGFTRSQHFLVGYDFKPASDWRIKAEVYYQRLTDVPVDAYASSFSMLNTGADFVFPDRANLVNDGTGFNRGAELTVEKFFSKGYYGLLSVSLFDSRYKGSDGIERSTAFDGGYVLNLLGGKEFTLDSKGRRALTFDTKVTFAGGRPYTPVNLEASQLAGEEVLYEDQAYSLKYDDYFRWDVKLGFRMNSPTKKFSQTFYLDFQNVTNNDNIFAMRYNEGTGRVGRIDQIGFFPDVLYRVEF